MFAQGEVPLAQIPYREVEFFSSEVARVSRADGGYVLTSAEPLGAYDRAVGSSGVPKAVVHTHGMLCAAARMQQQIAPFLLQF